MGLTRRGRPAPARAPKQAAQADGAVPAAPGSLRIDKWLWHARMCKTRSLAQRLILDGAVRVDGQRTLKPSQSVQPGAVLTLALNGQVRVLRVVALGQRRGPADEAQRLYDDLTEPAPRDPEAAAAPVVHPGGRPQGRDRRRLEALRRTIDD